MTHPTISVALATFNEEANIRRCLKAVSGWVSEIVIADEMSTDQTVALAKKFPKVKIITTRHEPIFHLTKQKAIDACHGDWILQLDADEVVSPSLRGEILATIPHTDCNGFWLKRKNFFLGKFLTKGGVYPDPTLRLYRRGFGHLPCQDVHEQAQVTGKVATLNQDLLHYADPTFARFLFRNDRYSTLLAQQLFDAKSPVTFFGYFIWKPLTTFISLYLRHRGYVDGFQGFVFAYYSALRFPAAYVKLFEMRQHVKI